MWSRVEEYGSGRLIEERRRNGGGEQVGVSKRLMERECRKGGQFVH